MQSKMVYDGYIFAILLSTWLSLQTIAYPGHGQLLWLQIADIILLMFQELSCFQAFKVNHEWCVPSQFMVAEISGEKIEKAGKRDYSFNATVYSKCQSKPLPRIPLHEDNGKI